MIVVVAVVVAAAVAAVVAVAVASSHVYDGVHSKDLIEVVEDTFDRYHWLDHEAMLQKSH